MERDWLMKIVPPWEKRHHPQFWAGVRFVAGCWVLVLTAILYGYHRAGWWTALLLLAAAGHFYYSYRLQQLSNARKAARHAA